VWSQIASVVSRFSEDSIFVLGYHITVGGIIIGILSMVGMVVTEENVKSLLVHHFSINACTYVFAHSTLTKAIEIGTITAISVLSIG